MPESVSAQWKTKFTIFKLLEIKYVWFIKKWPILLRTQYQAFVI